MVSSITLKPKIGPEISGTQKTIVYIKLKIKWIAKTILVNFNISFVKIYHGVF